MEWTMFFLFVVLKVPIVAACWIIWWAVRAEPDLAEEPEGGDGGQRRPPHPRPRLPHAPRRGPHGEPAPSAPPRVRTVVRGRTGTPAP